jgi:hypothetical protein
MVVGEQAVKREGGRYIRDAYGHDVLVSERARARGNSLPVTVVPAGRHQVARICETLRHVNIILLSEIFRIHPLGEIALCRVSPRTGCGTKSEQNMARDWQWKV